ncbi:hypothetical protein DO97_13560 [Neosynechococcus sphagnicola sy1]|uniref:FecR protein domain-containing protein n=1 Tax=Neosynechococcus sphagnicola sy1 TaxID=1497020 RepID=A0A098TJ61_9CYAN|nr:hypothetical protein [Neosynechococcus sphagnicola]KGF72042.1 hypothetical protein DO97_13560 [Neosynechococcus sphagnicola sy1]
MGARCKQVLGSPPSKWRIGRFTFGLCLFLSLSLVFHVALQAQSAPVTQAQVTEILDGTQVFIQEKQAQLHDQASLGQRVRTGDSRAQLTFNTGAVGRLAKRSVLTVGKTCARLQQGVLLIDGAVQGCTSSVIAGVHGTTYVLEVDETGQEQVKVIEGQVVVTRIETPLPDADGPELAPGQSPPAPSPLATPSPSPESSPGTVEDSGANQVVLSAGEKVNVDRQGRLGLIQKLTEDDFVNLLTGALFEGFRGQLPGISRIKSSFESLFPGGRFPISIPGLDGSGFPNLPINIPRPRLPFF